MSECSETTVRSIDDSITREDVEVIVGRALGPTVKLVDYHLKSFTKEKLGFMGAHRHLVVTIEGKANAKEESKTFFLKSMPYNVEVQASLIADCNLFYKEANFYRLIMPELTKSAKDKSWLPQCYLVKSDALVFENLNSRSFALKEKILDVDCLKATLAALANLHASSMLAEKRMGKTFIELYPKVFEECLFTRTNKFYEWFKAGVKLTKNLAETFNLNSSNIRDTCDRIFDMISTSKSRRNVVCHGDVKSFNMMFNDAKPVPKCILFDFQIIRYTCPTSDVLQLFYLNTRREFRDKHEKDLLKYYTQALADTLKMNDSEIKVPTFQEILDEYQENRLVGLITGVLYAPALFIDSLLCAEMTNDSDGFAKLLSGDCLDLMLDIMKQDTFYKNIVFELVKELVDRSN